MSHKERTGFVQFFGLNYATAIPGKGGWRGAYRLLQSWRVAWENYDWIEAEIEIAARLMH